MSTVLPPGVSRAAFNKACEEFRAIVGREWVFTDETALAPYRDPYYPGDPMEHTPSGTVAPINVEQVQGVLKVANRHGIPVWAVSGGKNFAYGGAAPAMSGSLVLDLNRMKKIEVNEEMAYAIVEPGVTYFDLFNHLQERKSRLWVDPPQPGWGSVIGNTLDRGLGYTAYADHSSSYCGLEVVLADGSLMRTGMGAQEDNPTWALYRYGFGPGVDGLFQQSNLGVVTRMGVWLMPAPETFAVVQGWVPNEADVIPLIDTVRELRIADVMPPSTITNFLRGMTSATTKAQWHKGEGAIPAETVERMKVEFKRGSWGVRFGLYGNEDVVAAKLKVINAELSKIQGYTSKATRYKRGDKVAGGDLLWAGTPVLSFGSLSWIEGVGAHVDQSPILPMSGQFVHDFLREKTELLRQHGFDHFVSIFNTSPRIAVNTASLVFDKSNPEQQRRVLTTGHELIRHAAKYHLGMYRGHLVDMDLAAGQFNFGNHAMQRFYERLKDTLDPKGILSPGKQGVWPKSLRTARKGGAR
jgi:4-cresol dehydrogenase (hydroxylating) flavoprotein subunit